MLKVFHIFFYQIHIIYLYSLIVILVFLFMRYYFLYYFLSQYLYFEFKKVIYKHLDLYFSLYSYEVSSTKSVCFLDIYWWKVLYCSSLCHFLYLLSMAKNYHSLTSILPNLNLYLWSQTISYFSKNYLMTLLTF